MTEACVISSCGMFHTINKQFLWANENVITTL
jgi:hypothetical protein